MNEQIQQTMYIEPSQPKGHGLKMIAISGTDMQEYDLYAFGKDRLLFGRDASQCDIVIDNDIVSRVHGKIKIVEGQLYLGDLGSTNGMNLYYEGGYIRMQQKCYYAKKSGDMILHIEGPAVSEMDNHVVIVFTQSDERSIWKRIPLSGADITIGRDPRNTIVMESMGFSRKHALIRPCQDGYMIFDNQSMNGVYVNGRRIQGSELVQQTDIVQIGGALFFLIGGCLVYQSASNGVSLQLQDINKIVGRGSGRKKILNRVSCEIGSNEFVAIIGGSGAGKTTVMNAMSGFDSRIEGKVLCNGIDLRQNFSALKNMIGFVPQQDIIYENLKLRRMLEYTAKMKMPSDVSPAERQERIQKVLDMVGLSEHAETYIRKLSGGQKKRASIAVELLADPGLFFLDEPTSGLDPDTEQSLMKTLAGLSKSEGKTIIMVTHTTQSIHLCDKVIFMGPGGKICYCGSPQGIYSYFQKKELVDVYNELAGNVDYWNMQYLQAYGMQSQSSHTVSEASMEKMRQSASRQVSSIRQLFVLTGRYFELIWNDKQRLLLLILQPLIISLLLTVVAKKDVFKIFNDTQSIMFALACAGIWIGLFNTIQEVCKERPILKREYMGNLRLWAYILSKYIVQGVLCVLQSTILTVIFLVAMKHAPKAAVILPKPQLEIWVTVFLTIYASAAMGLIVSAFVKNSDRAMAVAPFVLIIQLLFSGVLFELEGAAHKISTVTVSRWAMECLGNITNLNKLDMAVKNMPHEPNDFYNRGVSHLLQTWGILGLVAVICGVISVIVLTSLKRDQR